MLRVSSAIAWPSTTATRAWPRRYLRPAHQQPGRVAKQGGGASRRSALFHESADRLASNSWPRDGLRVSRAWVARWDRAAKSKWQTPIDGAAYLPFFTRARALWSLSLVALV